MNITRIFLILTMFFLVSCEKDEENETTQLEGSQAFPTITVSDNDLKWFLRSQPDSIEVFVSGGKPPYIIRKTPDFAASARIFGDRVIIYPRPFDPQGIKQGIDFINIQDSDGNVVPINITVEYRWYKYPQLDTSNLAITGDTVFNGDLLRGFNFIRWDGHTGNLIIRTRSDDQLTELELISTGVFGPGLYDLDSTFSELQIFRFSPSYSIMRPKDTSQKILIEEITNRKLKGSVIADFVSVDNSSWRGEVVANYKFTFYR